jgi:hypothetical protein
MCWKSLLHVFENRSWLKCSRDDQSRVIVEGMQQSIESRKARKRIKAHPPSALQFRAPRHASREAFPILCHKLRRSSGS